MDERIKIVVDDAIPFIRDVFEPYADVVYKVGKEISHADVLDADALVIRTRTKCNAALLDRTTVKFIATATIGMDHIDKEYCDSHGIIVRNAAGCNAGGVMNYVFSALYGVASRKALRLDGCKLGIVGVGNVGSRVDRVAGSLGFKVLKNDPPRMAVEGPEGFCPLDYLLRNSDIVTMHVPLDGTTRGMCNDEFFDMMKPGTIFINASRGEVVVDSALKKAIPKLGPVIIDTWNHEPDIDRELMDMVDIATPHIAGYSYQGKQNGTAASVRALSRFFGFEKLYDFFPRTEIIDLESIKLDLKGKKQGEVASVLQYNYPIFTDDFMLRMNPGNFEKLRSEYQYRREFYID
ncbi:MAG: 4-phosphoerythronate dehydrogenase [Bacteroidales bacterium]|nr:4-phosphoerythronate dehydrogenase [Bacteroidales bacterium]